MQFTETGLYPNVGHGRPIKAELEFSKKILTGFCETGLYPDVGQGCPFLQVGQGCPIKAELEFSKKILTGFCETGCLTKPSPTPDWSDFWLAKKSEGPSLWRVTESWTTEGKRFVQNTKK